MVLYLLCPSLEIGLKSSNKEVFNVEVFRLQIRCQQLVISGVDSTKWTARRRYGINTDKGQCRCLSTLESGCAGGYRQ